MALCSAVDCPFWPFRMGTDPLRKPASEARREAARRVMAGINARRRKRDGPKRAASPPEHGNAPSLAQRSEVAPTWATARVDEVPKTEPHRVDGTAAARPVSNASRGQSRMMAA